MQERGVSMPVVVIFYNTVSRRLGAYDVTADLEIRSLPGGITPTTLEGWYFGLYLLDYFVTIERLTQ